MTFVVLIVWNFTSVLQGVRFWKHIIFLFDPLFSTDKEVAFKNFRGIYFCEMIERMTF